MVQDGKHFSGTFLVPLDGSRLAESVLPTVIYLANGLYASVMLLHIMEQHPPATVHGERHLTNVAEAKLYLEEVASRLQTAGVSVKTHVHEDKENDVAKSLCLHVQEMHCELVIMCTHGRGGLRDLLFGSIAQQALQRGTQSILLVFPQDDGSVAPGKLQRILVPLDGTAVHEAALPTAITLARVFKAALHLVLVIPTPATLSGQEAVSGLLLPMTMKAILDLAGEGATSYLKRMVARCHTYGVPATSEVLRGDAAAVVRDLAKRINADLVVLASHGRTGLDALLAGSVAPRIAGRMNRPLLLVRVDAAQEEETREGSLDSL